jgi:hypothetical protein
MKTDNSQDKITIHQRGLKVAELCAGVLESAVETDDSYDSGILG